MTAYTDIRIRIIAKNIIKHSLSPSILRIRRLPHIRSPQGILLSKPILESAGRIMLLDVGLAASPIAGMDSDLFSEELFDLGDEGTVSRQAEVGEGVESGLETARKRTGVVGFRRGDLLGADHLGPEGVGFEGLQDAGRCEVGVGPGHGVVAVFGGPVALRGVRESQVLSV